MPYQEISTYLNLCTQVYDISKPLPDKRVYDFYTPYVQKSNGLILEPMCGTGRYMLHFLKEGFEVHGFDASEHMLQMLHHKAEKLNVQPKVWQSYLENFNSPHQYDVIIIPSSSFTLITDMHAVRASLKNIYNHLADTGTFVFEVMMLSASPLNCGVWNGSIWPRSDGKFIMLSTLDMPIQNNIGTTMCRYELVDGTRIIETEIEALKLRLYDPQEMIYLLNQVGFHQVRMINGFDAHGDGTVMVFECKKTND